MYTANNKWEKVGTNGFTDGRENAFHIPVLADEVLSWLSCRSGGRYVDCTVGQGGLASRILELSGPDGVLIGIDRDEAAIEATRNCLKRFEGRVQLIRGNFREFKQHLTSVGVAEVDGVVFDLGVSSA
ncbi:MAG: 16S rRNA (cytosine(1402)-N(4))-methyltransferase, partial [Nitrospirae bacterium]|nr:16S rRNA (cytosine(1402)-N(4))-methyltransferase [Nitrospirota bacterium]